MLILPTSEMLGSAGFAQSTQDWITGFGLALTDTSTDAYEPLNSRRIVSTTPCSPGNSLAGVAPKTAS